MTPEERKQLLEQYRSSFEAVQVALYKLGPPGLDRAPEGEWTPRQIVHHLADTELFRSTRLRMLLAEDEPYMPGHNEVLFAERLQYDRPVEASMSLVWAAMETNLQLLEGIEEADWHRAGTHGEKGSFSVEDWLQDAADHANDHASQILTYLPRFAQA